jgi:preprotein translocase subunit YajC
MALGCECSSQKSYSFMNLMDITNLLILAQQPASGAAGEAATDGGWASVLTNPFNFLLIAMLLLWVMVILPQQRQSREQQKKIAAALAGLKKNDHVVTVGGIHGVIVNASSDSPTVTIRIDDSTNAKMTINRDAIASVVTDTTT